MFIWLGVFNVIYDLVMVCLMFYFYYVVLIFFMVIVMVCIGKVMGMLIVVKIWGVENSKVLVFGFFMNIKGFVELIVFNIGFFKWV